MLIRRCFAAMVLWISMVAVAAAAPSLKALIVDGQNNHKWKETTPHLKKALEDTGLFSVDVATSPASGKKSTMAQFAPKFADYNVVVMDYTGQDWPATTQKAFEEYVAGGGGLVIFHAADNAFPNWVAFNEMIAVGGWGGRDEKSGPYLYWKDGKIVRDTSPGRAGAHGAQKPFQIVVRVPDHPITKGLPEKFTHSADELYSRLRGPAKNVTVLATASANPKAQEGSRHEPILMVIDYGKGRVFHTVIGHAGQQCKSVAFIVTLQRGAEWAATGKVTQPVPKDFPGPDRPSVRE